MSDCPGPSPAPDGGGFLGIVMLDTRFPRPPGDVGHPSTFPVPTRRVVVPGACPRRVVASGQALRDAGLVPRFVDAVRALQAGGAAAIVTSCGFLVLLQRELQQAVDVPVVASSLLLLPALLQRRAEVGVLTVDAGALEPEHLLAAGVRRGRLADVHVQGIDPGGELARGLLGNAPTLDFARCEVEAVAAARALQRRRPGLTDLVLECTNLPPYAGAIRHATGLVPLDLRDAPQLAAAFGARWQVEQPGTLPRSVQG